MMTESLRIIDIPSSTVPPYRTTQEIEAVALYDIHQASSSLGRETCLGTKRNEHMENTLITVCSIVSHANPKRKHGNDLQKEGKMHIQQVHFSFGAF